MIVVDTNIWVSATLLPASVPARAVEHIIASGRLAISSRQIGEIRSMLGRPRIRGRIDAGAAARVIALLRSVPRLIDPAETVTDCRDPKDNMLLEIALAAGATTIVSGDDDLLILDPWRGRRILTPRAYLDMIAEGNA